MSGDKREAEQIEVCCYSGTLFNQKKMYKEVGSQRLLINGLVFRLQHAFSSYSPGMLFEGIDESKVYFDIGQNLVVEDLIFGRQRILPIPDGVIETSCSTTNCLGEIYLAFVVRGSYLAETGAVVPLLTLCLYSETSKTVTSIPLVDYLDFTFKTMVLFSYCDFAFLLEKEGLLYLLVRRDVLPPDFLLAPLPLGEHVHGLHAMHDNSSYFFISTSSSFLQVDIVNKQIKLTTKIQPGRIEMAGLLPKLSKFVYLDSGVVMVMGASQDSPHELPTVKGRQVVQIACLKDTIAIGYRDSSQLTVIKYDKNFKETVHKIDVDLPDFCQPARLQLSSSGQALFVIGLFKGLRKPERYQPFCVTLIFQQYKAYCLRAPLLSFPQFPVAEPVVDIVQNQSLNQVCLLTESSLALISPQGSMIVHKLSQGAVALTGHPVLPYYFVASKQTYRAFYIASSSIKMTGYHESCGGISEIKFSPLGDKLAIASSSCIIIEKTFSETDRKSIPVTKTIKIAWVKNNHLLSLSEVGTVYVTDVVSMQRVRELYKARCIDIYYEAELDVLVGLGERCMRIWDNEKQYTQERTNFTAMLVVRQLWHVFLGTEQGEVRCYPWPVTCDNFDKAEYTSIKLHRGPVRKLFVTHELNSLISVGRDRSIFFVKMDMLSRGTIRLEDQLINQRKPELKLFRNLSFNLLSVDSMEDDSLATMKDKCRNMANDLNEQVGKRKEKLEQQLRAQSLANKAILNDLRQQYRVKGDALLKRLLATNKQMRLLEGQYKRNREGCQGEFQVQMAQLYEKKDNLDDQLKQIYQQFQLQKAKVSLEQVQRKQRQAKQSEMRQRQIEEMIARSVEKMSHAKSQFNEFIEVMRQEAECFQKEQLGKLTEMLASAQQRNKILVEQSNNRKIDIRRLRTRKAVLETLQVDLEESILKFTQERMQWQDFGAALAKEVEQKEGIIRKFQDMTRQNFMANLQLFKEKNALKAYYNEIIQNIQPLQNCLSQLELTFSQNQLELAKHHDRRIKLNSLIAEQQARLEALDRKIRKARIIKAASAYRLDALRTKLNQIFMLDVGEWKGKLQQLVSKQQHSAAGVEQRQRLYRSTCLTEAEWARVRSLKKEFNRVSNREFMKVSSQSAFFIRRTSQLIEINAKLKLRLKEIKKISLKEMGTHKFFELINEPTRTNDEQDKKELPFIAYKQLQKSRSQQPKRFGTTFNPKQMTRPELADTTLFTTTQQSQSLSITSERLRPAIKQILAKTTERR